MASHHVDDVSRILLAVQDDIRNLKSTLSSVQPGASTSVVRAAV
jgi:hypothetical protein